MRPKLELIWAGQTVFEISKVFRAEAKACIWMLVTVKWVAIPRRLNKIDRISKQSYVTLHMSKIGNIKL